MTMTATKPTTKEMAARQPWNGNTPRSWQEAALPGAMDAIIGAKNGVIRAVTGAGKSFLQAEIVARLMARGINHDERIIITAPTQKLVVQLGKTIGDFNGKTKVGLFYERRKVIKKPIIVACHDSLAALCEKLASKGISVRWWICDECHKSECDIVLSFAESIGDVPRIGFTATPFRSSEKESLSLWDELIFDYNAQQAIADGAIVAPEIVGYTGDEKPIDEACLDMIREVLFQGPGVVNSMTIEDAEEYSKFLQDHGINAEPIHSKMGKKQQKRLVKQLQDGTIRALVHVNMLSEGVDFPWLRWICLRRPVKSRVRFIQEVGRVLRAAPGKKVGFILDPNDLFSRHDLDYDALLGEAPPQDEEVPTEEEEPREPKTPEEEEAEKWKVKGNVIRSYLRSMATRARAWGWAKWKPDRDKFRGLYDPPSAKQKETVKYLMDRVRPYVGSIPTTHRDHLRDACLCLKRETITMRDAADLIDVLGAIKMARGWELDGEVNQ